MAENDIALQLAEAERELRRRQNSSEGGSLTPLNVINEVNKGLLGLMPSAAREKLNSIGVGVETDLPKDYPATAKGLEFTGGAIPFALAAPAMGISGGGKIIQNRGVFKTMLDDIAKFATNNPKSFLATEGAAAFGAGALGESARQGGAGPATQLGAELLGGMTAGGLTAIAPRTLRGARETIASNLFPMTNEGGEIRAARQMQERAGGPEQAARSAQLLDSIPDGVTPAQWIGDERLMAQEARLLADNPQLENVVRTELQEARLAAQQELTDANGRPRTRQEWEAAVLDKVTPEGFSVSPGMSDDMLDQAYRSFEPLYAGAKGHPVSSSGIADEIAKSPNNPSVISTDFEREAVEKWLKSRMTAYSDDLAEAEVASDVLLDLRSKIRDERRLQTNRGRHERADLLGSAEAVLTSRIQRDLPPGATDVLNQADSQYRKYKVIENAIFEAGDSNLTPEGISKAIQNSGLTTDSRYARGVDEATQELRGMAMSGRSTEEVFGDPQRAKLFVRGMEGDDLRGVHADFTETLFNRAKSSEATDSGIGFLSGEKLLRDLSENADVMKSLGMSDKQIANLRYIGENILKMGKKPPAAVSKLFTDGPASIMELGAALIGAKQGQRMAGNGIGSGLVLAQYMSNKARGLLANLTSNQAEQLMTDAVTDPKLYRTLLTRGTAGRESAREQAAYLESWLLASAVDKINTEEAQ